MYEATYCNASSSNTSLVRVSKLPKGGNVGGVEICIINVGVYLLVPLQSPTYYVKDVQELEIKEYNSKANYLLAWRSYSIHTLYRNGSESISEFDLVQNQFPAFWFSRVKSYTSDVESPLQ